MAKVLDLLDLVPGWCWAISVIALGLLCGALELGRLTAQTSAAEARRDLLLVQLASARAIGTEKDRAAERVRNLNQSLTETQDALFKAQQALPARVAVLDGRLQQHARPVACRSTTPAPAASGPAGVGDGNAGTGLRGLDGQDLVLVDGQARHELAEFAVSARGVGETLIQVRGLLRRCWRNESGAVPAPP
jgi:hypothetical protein